MTRRRRRGLVSHLRGAVHSSMLWHSFVLLFVNFDKETIYFYTVARRREARAEFQWGTHVAGFLVLHILPQSRPPAPPWGAGRYRLLDLLPPLVLRSPTCHVPPSAQVAASSVVIKCFQLQGLQISPNIHDLSRGDACPLVLRPQPERRAASGEPRNRAPLEPGSRRRGTRKTPSCPKLFTP